MQSVMFDGSHHGFETNIALTRQVADYAHADGVIVEAELGSLPGFEDEVFAENAVYTDPSKVCEFIERSGCDSLAIAVGTTHGGVKGDDYLPMDMERVKAVSYTHLDVYKRQGHHRFGAHVKAAFQAPQGAGRGQREVLLPAG